MTSFPCFLFLIHFIPVPRSFLHPISSPSHERHLFGGFPTAGAHLIVPRPVSGSPSTLGARDIPQPPQFGLTSGTREACEAPNNQQFACLIIPEAFFFNHFHLASTRPLCHGSLAVDCTICVCAPRRPLLTPFGLPQPRRQGITRLFLHYYTLLQHTRSNSAPSIGQDTISGCKAHPTRA